MGSEQGKAGNSALITHSLHPVAWGMLLRQHSESLCLSLKQLGHPSDKPLLSSSLGRLPGSACLAVASLHYREEAKEEKYLLRVIPMIGTGLDIVAT